MTRNYNWKTGCNVEATLSVIGGRWKPVIVCHLLAGADASANSAVSFPTRPSA